MRKVLFIISIFVLITSFIQKPRKFPEINYVTNKGTSFSNEDFQGKNTIVLLFHLGCPYALNMLKDIETAKLGKNDSIQIIGIVENTPEQIKQFNSSQNNLWSDTRKSFNLEPIEIPLIGECASKNLSNKNVNMHVGSHCEDLSKKIKTRYSPTVVFVDHNGNIAKVKKGYISKEAPLEERIEYVTEY